MIILVKKSPIGIAQGVIEKNTIIANDNNIILISPSNKAQSE